MLVGVDACDQCLIHAARPMTNIHRLSMYGVGQNSTIHLNRRMRGGASDWELIVKPRVQKDRWSDYWKVRVPPHLMGYPIPPDVDGCMYVVCCKPVTAN